MNKIWKNMASRVWLIVTPIVLALVLAVSLVASFPLFNTVCVVLNSARRMELLAL